MESIGLKAILDDKDFQAGLQRYIAGQNKIQKATDETAHSINASGGMLNSISGTLSGSLTAGAHSAASALSRVKDAMGEIAKAGLAATAGLAAIGGVVLKVGFDFNSMKQQSEIAFTTILGSGEKAKALLDEIQKFAAETPFEFPELVAASKKLAAFGFDAKNIIPTMHRLGDISAGVGVNVSELADIYGKAKVQGRLFAEDINQLTGRGIPIIQELAKQFGVSESQVRKLVEDGKVGFPQLEKAFQSLTDKGGKFSGLMAAQSRSFSGLMSTLKDNLTQIAAAASKPIFDKMNNSLQQLVDLMSTPEFTQGVEQFGFVISDIVALFTDFDAPIGDASNALEALAADMASLANLFGLNGTAIEETVLSIGQAFVNLSKAFQSGGLSGFLGELGTQISNLAGNIAKSLQANWPQISAQLASWGTQFWNWLTGTVIPAIATQIGKVVAALSKALKDNWPAISATLGEWATKFWDWVTGKEGLLAQVAVKMDELSKSMTDWAESSSTKTAMQGIGKTLGKAIVDALGSFLSQPGTGESALSSLFSSIQKAMEGLSKNIGSLGGDFVGGMVGGMVEGFVGEDTAKRIADAISKAVSDILRVLTAPGGPLIGLFREAGGSLMEAFTQGIGKPPDLGSLFKAPSAPAPTGGKESKPSGEKSSGAKVGGGINPLAGISDSIAALTHSTAKGMDTFKSVVGKAFAGIKTSGAGAVQWFQSLPAKFGQSTKAIGDKVQDIQEAFEKTWKTIQKITDITWKAIVKTINDALKDIVKAVTDAFKGLASTVSDKLNDVKAAVISVFNSIVKYLQGLADDFKKAGTAMMTALKNAIVAMGDAVMDAVIKPLRDAMNWITKTDWAALGRGIMQKILSGIQALADTVYNTFLSPFTRAWDWLTKTDWSGVARNIMQSLLNGINSLVQSVYNTFLSPFTRAWDWLTNADWRQLGADLIQTLNDGITSVANVAYDNIVKPIQDAWNWITTQDWYNVGADIFRNITAGLNALADQVADALRGPLQALIDIINSIINTVSGGSSGFGGAPAFDAQVGQNLAAGLARGFGTPALSYSVTGANAASRMVSGVTNNRTVVYNYNLYTSTAAPVSTVVQDFGIMQSIAGV